MQEEKTFAAARCLILLSRTARSEISVQAGIIIRTARPLVAENINTTVAEGVLSRQEVWFQRSRREVDFLRFHWITETRDW